MKRILWLIATLLTLGLILAGASALVLTTRSVDLDVTAFKDRISATLLEHTGLEFRVDGELHLQVGPSLGLKARGLHVRNPILSEAGDLLDAELAALEVETLPVFSGKFEPTFLRLEGAKLNLVLGKAGDWNWQPGAPNEKADGNRDGEAPREDLLLPDRLRVVGRDVRINYQDGRTGSASAAVLKAVELEPAQDALKVKLDGTVDGYPLVLRGNTATLSQLIDGSRAIPLDLQGNLLGLSVNAKGNLANPRTGAKISASLRIDGKSLAGLRPWVGEQIAAKGPVKASLDIKGGGKAYELSDFQVAIGKSRFDGGLKLDLSGQKPNLDLKLGIEEVDLTPLLEPGNAAAGHPAPEDGGRRTGLFSDEPLSVAWMDSLELKAHVRLRNLISPYTSVRNVDMEVGLTSGNLSVKGAGKNDDGRSESFDIQFKSDVQPLVASLHYKGDKLLLEPLLAGTSARGMIEGEVDISADLKATGNSGNRLAGSLSGKLLFLVERAKADLRQLDRLTPGVESLFGQLAVRNAQSAQLNCGLAAFDFRGGKTKVDILVDSPVSTVIGHGDLDLGAETLKVRVTPHAKGAHLKVDAPVLIHGSLSSLDYTVEKGELLVSLTELASRVAVPQLLLLDAFGEAVAENPCVKIAAGKVDPETAEPLEAVTKPVESVLKGAGAIVEGAGTVVKDAGGAVIKGTGQVIKGVGGAIGGLLGGRSSQGESSSEKDSEQKGGGAFLDD